MIMTIAKSALTEAILAFRLPDETIRDRTQQIQQHFLAHSPHVLERNFTSISRRDIEFLFSAYDERFFAGLCSRTLDGYCCIN